MKNFFFTFAVSFIYLNANAQTGIYINEFMASNTQAYADIAGEYEDWIEIYNDNNSPIDLAGFYITDDVSKPTKYPLTSVPSQLVIPAKGFLIIWGGGNLALGPDHIDIGLSAGGESLALVAPDGTTVLDSYTFPAQRADVSMGRTIDGVGEWKFLFPSSPKASNQNSTSYNGFLAPPAFSQSGGLYTSPFNLTITSSEPGTTILYTLDGSIPQQSALEGETFRYKNSYPQNPGDPFGPFLTGTMKTQIYNAPIEIKNRTSDPNVVSIKSSTYHLTPYYVPNTLIKKAHTIRARVFKEGYLPSEVITQSYFPAEGGKSRYTLPVISLSIPEKYLFSWDTGIYNAGRLFELWRTFLPNAVPDGSSYANYQTSWEYPLSMEYFATGTGVREFQRNAGFRIHGSFSAALPRKSLRIYFRSEYGESNLGYPIYPNRPENNYKRLILRNAGNEGTSLLRNTYMRDMALQQLIRHLDVDIQDAQPAIVYINGEYWGLHNIRERQDRHYLENKYGIKEGELDLLEGNAEVEEGDAIAYNALYNYVANQNTALPAVYDSINKLMDINNFIDYQVAEIFLGNTDWPHNNVRYYRKRTNYDTTAPKGQDGRFRWAVYDLDFCFGFQTSDPVTLNNLNRATNASGGNAWATLLLRRLLLNSTFKNQFINRFADLLNSAFLPERTATIINHFREIIAPEIPEHILRWRGSGSLLNWQNAVDDLIAYGNHRPDEQRNQILSKFSISQTHNITLNVSNYAHGIVKINSIDIDSTTPGIVTYPYPWTGKYFNNIPIALIAKAKPGYRFVKWDGDINSTDNKLVVNILNDLNVTAVYEVDPNVANNKIVHYWHFNNLPSGNLDNIVADSSVVPGSLITYAGTSAGYMDRTNTTDGSDLNTQYNTISGQALRVRNPSDTRSLIISTPSTGFKNIAISYAAQRTNNGAQIQRVSYSPDNGTTWKLIIDNVEINEEFELLSFDLKDTIGTENNENLQIKIEFLGSNSAGSSGNNRFDNLLISGVKLETACTPGEWLGTVNSDWFNPANWCGAIPSTTDEVVIGAGKPNYPVVTANSSITIKSLNLLPGTTIKLLQNVQLTVEGGSLVVKGNIQVGENSTVNLK